MSPEATATRERLLDTAEHLFAERGIDATSLRAITTAAEANLASVNYHFGSKDALFQEVIARRIRPVNAERLRLLDECESQADAQPPSIEGILEAMLAPALRLQFQKRGGKHFMCLMGRLYSEPRADELKMLFFAEFKEVFKRFTAALQRALPDLSKQELVWRFFFMIGSMSHLMSAGDMLKMASDGLCDPDDVEGTLQRLVDYTAAGFRAPVTQKCGESI